VIGHYGDRVGRKSMLVLTLVIMGVATFLIGLLPTYASIGAWAPVLLVVFENGSRVWCRRRVGRRDSDGSRACAKRKARLLWKLASDRRTGGTAVGQPRLSDLFHACRSRRFWPGDGGYHF
jgi:hypothetical protein